MPRRSRSSRIGNLAADTAANTVGETTDDLYPDGVPKNRDGSIKTDAEISVEDARRIGAVSDESARHNKQLNRAVRRKNLGDKDVKFSSSDAMQTFESVKLAFGTNNVVVYVKRIEPDPPITLEPFAMAGIKDAGEFYKRLLKLHRGRGLATYRVLFREGSYDRGVGNIVIDQNDEAAAPTPATAAAPVPQPPPSPWGPQPPWYPQGYPMPNMQPPPPVTAPAAAPMSVPPPQYQQDPYVQALIAENQRRQLESDTRTAALQMQMERTLGELAAMRQQMGVAAPPPPMPQFIQMPAPTTVPVPTAVAAPAPIVQQAPVPPPPTPAEAMQQSMTNFMGMAKAFTQMRDALNAFGGDGGGDAPPDMPVVDTTAEDNSPFTTIQVPVGDRTIPVSMVKATGKIANLGVTALSAAPIIIDGVKDVFKSVQAAQEKRDKEIREYTALLRRQSQIQMPVFQDPNVVEYAQPPTEQPPPPPVQSAIPTAEQLAAMRRP